MNKSRTKIQRANREKKVKTARSMKETCISFLTHGWYFDKNEHGHTTPNTFKVPSNIRLHHYVKPGMPLFVPTARVLEEEIKKSCKVKDQTVYVGLSTREIVKQEIQNYVDEPNTMATNMNIDFRHDVPGFEMGVKLFRPDMRAWIFERYQNGARMTLQYLVHEISGWCNKHFPGKVINLHQLTCHEGDFLGYKKDGRKVSSIDDTDVTNLTALMNAVRVSHIRDLKGVDGVYINSVSTNYDEVFKSVSKLGKRKRVVSEPTRTVRKKK